MSEMAQPRDIIVSARNLSVSFPTRDKRRSVRAVDGVDFDVRRGETFGVIGESGSGKTTLARVLVLLQKASGGTLDHDNINLSELTGRALRKQRRDYQIIFQDPNAALDPRMTVGASVREPLDLAQSGTRSEREAAAIEALVRVGLGPDYARRYPHQLSGGQKQRVLIARALVLRPKLIVCDEVVAALDMSIRGEVLNLFAELKRSFGITFVFITHDIGVAVHISDRIAVMYLGRLVELGPAGALADDPLHPYTEALLSAEPLALPSRLRTERRIVLEGEIPDPAFPPSGCRFRTRCRYAKPLCTETIPDWRELRSDHWVACHFAEKITNAN
jgi:oligopeptide/dipeptide ABC transporter ATP-binding protein